MLKIRLENLNCSYSSLTSLNVCPLLNYCNLLQFRAPTVITCIKPQTAVCYMHTAPAYTHTHTTENQHSLVRLLWVETLSLQLTECRLDKQNWGSIKDKATGENGFYLSFWFNFFFFLNLTSSYFDYIKQHWWPHLINSTW